MAYSRRLEPPVQQQRRFHPTFGRLCAGVVVAVVLFGQLLFLIRIVTDVGVEGFGAPAVAVPRTGTLAHRIDVVLTSSLGPSDRGVQRYRLAGVQRDVSHPHQVDLTIIWSINNDLSEGTLGNGAASDVYLMLRNLYSSHLPIATIRLRGTYPVPDRHGHSRETTVMRLDLDRPVATLINREGWDSLDAQALWPLVNRRYVAPDFQPQANQ